MAKSIAIVAGSYHKEKVEKMVGIVKSLSSENNLLKVLGSLNATKKASAYIEVPKNIAINISLK